MEFKRFEALIEMFPQVQIFSTEGEDLDRVITHFLNQRKNVSTMSEAMQRKIQHALAPFFQQRFISLHDEEAPLVRHLLLKKKFFLQTDRYIDDMAWPETDPDKLEDALKIADLTEEAYQGVEDRIVSLTVAFNSQMNALKQEADYQGKNWAILSRKGVANFQLLEGAAADFSSTFQSLGLENSVAYKGFATAQAIISSILAANRVLAEEPGGAIIKGIAAAATLAAGLANVAAIWAVNPDGSNAGSSMNTSMEQPAVPVIGNAQPINYYRNVTEASPEDEMNKYNLYVRVTDIDEGLEGQRVRVQNSSF